jgi:hypothetical protein
VSGPTNESVGPGKSQPQKYTKLGGLLLLRALVKLVRARLKRDDAKKAADIAGLTIDGGNAQDESTENLESGPAGNGGEIQKNAVKRRKLSPEERESNRKKRKARKEQELASITRDLEHFMSMREAKGNDDQKKALRDRRIALLGKDIDVSGQVMATATNAIRTLPFGIQLEKVLKAVLIVERDDDFLAAIPTLDRLYLRAAKVLPQRA